MWAKTNSEMGIKDSSRQSEESSEVFAVDFNTVGTVKLLPFKCISNKRPCSMLQPSCYAVLEEIVTMGSMKDAWIDKFSSEKRRNVYETVCKLISLWSI